MRNLFRVSYDICPMERGKKQKDVNTKEEEIKDRTSLASEGQSGGEATRPVVSFGGVLK